MATENLFDAAVAYSGTGMAVFPCCPGAKRPLTRHGYRDASADFDDIMAWWSDAPDANIAVWPGHSRHVVLDIDCKGDADGEVSLAALEREHGELPETWTVTTPSGGKHLWFTLPGGMAPPANAKPASGIDVRSGNGYVLLPPSATAGGAYRVASDAPSAVAELPAPWARLLDNPVRERADGGERDAIPASELDLAENVERARVFLARTAPPAIQGEGGDQTTFQVACQVRDLGVSAETCLDLMAKHYNPRCDPPWNLHDGSGDPEGKTLDDKVAHAYNYAKSPLGQFHKPDARDAFAEYAQAGGGGPEAGLGTMDAERKTRPPRLLSPSDVEDLEPPEWLLDDCLPRASFVALYGEPGSFKSFLALDWAYHLAHGMTWANYEPDGPCRVLYVAGEGTAGIKKRLKAWRMHHDVELGGDTDGNLVVSDTMPQIGDMDAWHEWKADIEADGPWDLVIFDTLAYLTFGLEENSNTDMMYAVKRLSDLRESTGASVMVVHHSGKNGDTLRGATSLLGACDTVFRLDKDTQVRGQGRLHMTKQKDAEQWHGHLGIQAREYEVGRDRKNRAKTSLAMVKGYHNVTPSEGEKQAESAQEAFKEVPIEEKPEEMGKAIGEILRTYGKRMTLKELAGQLALHFGHEASEQGYIESLLKSEYIYKHPAVNQYVPPKQLRGGKVPEWWRLPNA